MSRRRMGVALIALSLAAYFGSYFYWVSRHAEEWGGGDIYMWVGCNCTEGAGLPMMIAYWPAEKLARVFGSRYNHAVCGLCGLGHPIPVPWGRVVPQYATLLALVALMSCAIVLVARPASHQHPNTATRQ